jgi:predicted phosphodiesterase
MERTKQIKKPSAILCADLHLREDTPICFTGDFQKEQWGALDFISELQRKYSVPVLCSGDVYDHWKPSPWLLSKTIEHIPDSFYTVLGNHDLPQHSMELFRKCGVYTLEKANKIHVLPFCHFGTSPDEYKEFEGSVNFGGPKILVWHHLTYLQKPYPEATGGMAEGLLMKYPKFSLIVTGDNHCSFSVQHEGRLLVNPGNLTRQVADQIDFQPRVALWYAEDNSITWVNLPIQEGVISRAHIEQKQERDERINAFVSSLEGDWKATMSFEDNLENFISANEVEKNVESIIFKAIEK